MDETTTTGPTGRSVPRHAAAERPPAPAASRPAGDEPGAGLGPDERCPQCAARVAAGISWCSQCYADLRTPEPAPEPEPRRPALPEAAGLPRGAGAEDPGPESTSTSTSTSTTEVDADELERISATMLAELAAQPSVGGARGVLDRGLGGTGAKTVVIVVGTLAVGAVGFLLMYVVGALL